MDFVNPVQTAFCHELTRSCEDPWACLEQYVSQSMRVTFPSSVAGWSFHGELRKVGVRMDADVIIVGGGLAGLVASNELVKAGKRVAIVDQENSANLGGQAFWSFGGIFLVNTPNAASLRSEGLFRSCLARLAGQCRLGSAHRGPSRG